MTPRISVVLSTHNPHPRRLARTLQGIFSQDLPADEWELIVVDNASEQRLDASRLGLALRNARLVREDRLGLLFGRLAGIDNSRGDLILFCDDDNVLAPDFLAQVVAIFSADPRLGNASGKAVPEFEVTPPGWLVEFEGCLALRNFGDEPRICDGWTGSYPEFAFGGGGATFKREALKPFRNAFGRGDAVKIPGRTGNELTSGEDNDLVLAVVRAGFRVGYFPELVMTHLIPARRLNRSYLGRLNHGIAKSWVQVLSLHGICPWSSVARWTVPIRKGRAFFHYHAWAGPAEYVRWRGACGHFEGRALIE